MRVANAIREVPRTQAQPVTLLELVQALGEVTDDDREVVAAVLDLLLSGRVSLAGNFRGHPAEDFC